MFTYSVSLTRYSNTCRWREFGCSISQVCNVITRKIPRGKYYIKVTLMLVKNIEQAVRTFVYSVFKLFTCSYIKLGVSFQIINANLLILTLNGLEKPCLQTIMQV